MEISVSKSYNGKTCILTIKDGNTEINVSEQIASVKAMLLEAFQEIGDAEDILDDRYLGKDVRELVYKELDEKCRSTG